MSRRLPEYRRIAALWWLAGGGLAAQDSPPPKVAPLSDANKPFAAKFHGSSNSIAFKNSDSKLLTVFHWKLTSGELVCGSPDDGHRIAPGAPGYLPCTLTLTLNDLLTAGTLKPDERPARIRVASSAEQLDTVDCLACADFDGTITLDYFDPTLQPVINGMVLLALLFTGGVLSHLIATALPNLSSKLRLRSRLDRVKLALAWAGADLDPEFPAMFAAQRARLVDIVRTQRSYSNDTADHLKQVDTELTSLENRVAVAARLVALRRQLGGAARTAFRRERLDSDLRALIPDLLDDRSTDGVVSAVQKKLRDLQTKFPAGVDQEFETFCTQRATELAQSAAALASRTKCARELARALDRVQAGHFEPALYDDLELAIRKLSLACKALSLENRNKLKTAECDRMICAIHRADPDGLELLRGRLFEIEEGLTAAGAITQLRRAGSQCIVIEPAAPEARASALVRLRLSPSQQEMVREKLILCHWNFEHAGRRRFHAAHSSVPCYFAVGGRWTVTLTLSSPLDSKIAKIAGVLTVRERKDAFLGQKGRVEAVRIAATQLLAAVAAVAATSQKIAGANLFFAILAALAAGYAADTVKNIAGKLTAKLTPTEDRATAEASKEAAAAAVRG
jgi:hypothetical protein